MISIFERFDHSFDIKSIDKEHRIISGTASLEEVDRDGEIIAMSAFEGSLDLWKTNPVIRWMHKIPIGHGIVEKCYVEKGVNGGELIVTAYITDKTQDGKDAWGLIEDGIVKSFSVGGSVIETDKVKMNGKDVTRITKMELYEVSVVDLPSNRKSFFSVIAKSLDGKDNDNTDFGCKGAGADKTQKGETKMAEEKTEKAGIDTAAASAPSMDEISKSIDARVDKSVSDAVAKLQPVYKFAGPEMDSKSTKAAQASGEISKIATYAHPSQVWEANKSIMPESSEIGTEYYGGIMSSVDKRVTGWTFKEAYAEYMEKYTNTQTGGAGTAGYALIPVYPDATIIDRTRREIPFIEMLQRRAVRGLTFDYNAITTLTNAVTLNEDGTLSDLTDVYDRFSTSMTYLHSVGRVSNPATVAARGYIDLIGNEVEKRTMGLKRYEDQLCLQAAKTSPEMDSLADLITTNETALGGPLTVSSIRTELAQCYDAGASSGSMLLVTTNTLSNSMKGLMMDYQRYVDTTKIAWGIETMSFDGVPVIVDRYVPSGYVYMLDMSVIFMAVLQDMTYEEKPNLNDSFKFDIKAYEALVCQAEAFCSILTGAT